MRGRLGETSINNLLRFLLLMEDDGRNIGPLVRPEPRACAMTAPLSNKGGETSFSFPRKNNVSLT